MPSSELFVLPHVYAGYSLAHTIDEPRWSGPFISEIPAMRGSTPVENAAICKNTLNIFGILSIEITVLVLFLLDELLMLLSAGDINE